MPARQGRPPLPKGQRLVTVQIKVHPTTLAFAKDWKRRLKLRSLSEAFRRMLGESENNSENGLDSEIR